MKYQIPVDGWYSDKVSAASASEIREFFGEGAEVIVRSFPDGGQPAAKVAAENISCGYGVRTCAFTDASGKPAIAADADSFARLSYLYLPVIHVHSRAAA